MPVRGKLVQKAVFFAVKLCYNFAVLKVAALTFKMLSV